MEHKTEKSIKTLNTIPKKIYLNTDETEQNEKAGKHARILINFIIVTLKCLSIYSKLIFLSNIFLLPLTRCQFIFIAYYRFYTIFTNFLSSI